MSIHTTVSADEVQSHATDLLALFVREGLKDTRFVLLDRALDGLLSKVAREEEFAGKEGQALQLHTHGKLPAQRIAILGATSLDSLRSAAARAVRLAKAAGAKSLAISWPAQDAVAEAQALAEGASLGAYVFDRYKKEKKPLKLAHVALLAAKNKALEPAIAWGRAVADATCRARDLVNEPAGRVTPSALANEARAVCKERGLKCEVLGKAAIEKLNMRLFLAVAQGSAEEPQLVRMSYTPARAAKRAPVALVGKAITFDSGGLSIKTASGMEEMKTDMAGAAAVIAAMELVSLLKPPFPVRGYFGACENLPSGTAYKPGDVITGRGGLSVEVLNTDAEGRLVLADVLSWAQDDKPSAIVDLATLTGAVMVALGPWTAGLFSNDEKLAAELLAAASSAGESAWRLPLPKEMEELIKSPIADLKNTGGRWGGAINAALFLQKFIRSTPWAHLDIAGPAAIDRERGVNPRGATGAGVRLLAAWLKALADR